MTKKERFLPFPLSLMTAPKVISKGGGMVSSTEPQSGKGSPFDAAVSIFGGVFSYEKTPR